MSLANLRLKYWPTLGALPPGRHPADGWPAGVPTLRGSIPWFAAELRRARRYNRSLAVMAVASGSPRPDTTDGKGRMGTQAVSPSTHDADIAFYLLGALLRDTLRETDIVAYSAEHHLYVVLLPECGETAGWGAAERLGRILHARAETLVRAGTAEFPSDGLTFEDLFGAARSRLRELSLGDAPLSEPKEA